MRDIPSHPHVARDPAPAIINVCAYCGESDFSPNVEAFEELGELICDDCAEAALEDNGQFGVGA